MSLPLPDRLPALRQRMRAQGLDACFVPSSDPHLSEYLPEHFASRAWLSGFDGSAGSLLVTQDFAGLWTDSRYWEQAQAQLKDGPIKLMRQGVAGVPEPLQWLSANLPAKSTLALDGRVFSLQAHDQWLTGLSAAAITLCSNFDPVAGIWPERAPLPDAAVFEHLPPYACRSRADNLAQLRARMHDLGANAHLLSSLDDIAWLLNLRGADVKYNPVFLAHALILPERVWLYLDEAKIDAALRSKLLDDGVELRAYAALTADLAQLARGTKLLLDPSRVTWASVADMGQAEVIRAANPSQLLKAQKNAAEADNIRRTMAYDGAALCEFFAWFEQALESGQSLSELDVDTQLNAARARQPGFVSPSFATIAGFNANGAMPHYCAREDDFAYIQGAGLLLIDSGGQYLGGTTDITRVVAVGTPSLPQRSDFTLVLKAHIALARAVFPQATAAALLDTMARMPLWQQGLDYGHGTGHGVGYFLNVHEGPQAISVNARMRADQAMLAGMLTSNEPGLYRPGKWGIRIENLVLCVPHQVTEFGDFLCFETVSLCPIDRRCIVLEQLDQAELDWLNNYHLRVRQQLAPLLQGAALDWLLRHTERL